MRVFFYNATFEGLLSAVFDAYSQREFPDLLLEDGAAAPLQAAARHNVPASPDKAGRVFAALQKKLSRLALQKIMLVWLSEEAGSVWLLFRYLCGVIDSPSLREQDLSNPLVLEVQRLARKVACERHKLLGFLRFQKTSEGLYFAAIAPRHNVLSLLLRHFAERFSGECWLIYDVKRRYGVFYDGQGFKAAELNVGLLCGLEQNGRLGDDLLHADEALLERLWRDYFKAVTIRERLNPELQKKFMPRRYWKYLTEMQGEFSGKTAR